MYLVIWYHAHNMGFSGINLKSKRRIFDVKSFLLAWPVPSWAAWSNIGSACLEINPEEFKVQQK